MELKSNQQLLNEQTPLAVHSYRKCILHVDGDSFFASCEIAHNPQLRGKPVVTGWERGIATSLTYEAKKLGVVRGMKVSDIKKFFPQVIVMASHYELYSLYSLRMYSIVRRYTPDIEEFSVDECYADLTGLRIVHHSTYEEIALKIKHDLETELGMTFSMGIGPNKTIAKLASKYKKPSGFTPVPAKRVHIFLDGMPVEKICGVGPSTTAQFNKLGIKTALDLAKKNMAWVDDNLSKPFREIWAELHGEFIFKLKTGSVPDYQSIMKAHTFIPTQDKEVVFSEISRHIESLCIRLRKYKLGTSVVCLSIKTQSFSYKNVDLLLPRPTAVPEEILPHLRLKFDSLWKSSIQGKHIIRASSITLGHLVDITARHEDLFGASSKAEKLYDVYSAIDSLAGKFGRGTVFLGSSFNASEAAVKDSKKMGTYHKKRNLDIPILGWVS